MHTQRYGYVHSVAPRYRCVCVCVCIFCTCYVSEMDPCHSLVESSVEPTWNEHSTIYVSPFLLNLLDCLQVFIIADIVSMGATTPPLCLRQRNSSRQVAMKSILWVTAFEKYLYLLCKRHPSPSKRRIAGSWGVRSFCFIRSCCIALQSGWANFSPPLFLQWLINNLIKKFCLSNEYE